MPAKFRIAAACLAAVVALTGCSTAHEAIARKNAVQKQLDKLQKDGSLTVQWKDVNIQGERLDRVMLSLELGNAAAPASEQPAPPAGTPVPQAPPPPPPTLYATTQNGLLFLVDAVKGYVRAFYYAGAESPIKPPVVRGSYLGADFIYLVHHNTIHAVANPDAEGILRAAWTLRHDGIIDTPLCETESALFFGDRDNHLYALVKGRTSAANMITMVSFIDAPMSLAPVTADRKDTPYVLDSAGDLYHCRGFSTEPLKPILPTRLGGAHVPMLIDEPSETLLVATDSYRLTALDSATGRNIKWTRQLGDRPVGEMYIYNAAAYVINAAGQLMAFRLTDSKDGRTSQPLWGDKKIPGVVRVLSQGANNTLYILFRGNRLAKLDTAAGKILWERQLPDVDFIAANPSGPTIYLGTKEGFIWAVTPN